MKNKQLNGFRLYRDDPVFRMAIKYYAVVKNLHGEIEQLLIVRKGGKTHSITSTGKLYKTMKEARTDLIRLNCG